MNVAAPTQLCGGGPRGGRDGRRRRPAVLRLDLRWARLLRLAVATRVVRLVWDQLLACSSCGGGGGSRYRRLGPPHAHGDVLTPVARDDDGGCAVPDADAADVEDVVGLKVSLLGDCQIGKTSFMVIINFFLLFSFFIVCSD
jgi:Rab family protein